ncbi:MAG TPA: efflux RND transporter periplasmic adaptor subunit [Candidatus Nitrosotenuis sp.]|nr:efflux RND transporter periplasmic adaptor subunit [Candidatus Nitrosotenuis sp.]
MIFVLLLIAAGGVLAGTRLARSEPAVPTVEVSTGEFVAHLPLRGELKALKSMVLIAPSYSGDLQIIKLVKNGTPVKKGDVVAVFDSTNLERQLGQRQTELRQAESEIERTRAQGNMVEEQNRTELIRAQYAVERAKLETTKAEILSEIEGAKNRLLLANAEKKMKEVEQKLASDKTANAADLESRRQRRDKAKREVGEFERRIAALTLLAPADGVVNLLPNFRAGGPFTQAPEFKEGDRAWPGAAVAELPDMNTLRAIARVEEIDRGRLEKGQTAVVRVDAIPEKEFPARIVAISPMAKPDFSSWPPQRTFDIEFQLDGTDPRMRPGMSANAQVAVERLPGSVLVPPEAVFQKNGRTIVYVLRGGKFEEQEIAVLRRSGTQVAVARGAKPGDKLAKRDPTLTEDAVK